MLHTYGGSGPSQETSCGLKRSRWLFLRSRREFIVALSLPDWEIMKVYFRLAKYDHNLSLSQGRQSTNGRNIVGLSVLRPFALNHNNVGTCWQLLRIVWNWSNF